MAAFLVAVVLVRLPSPLCECPFKRPHIQADFCRCTGQARSTLPKHPFQEVVGIDEICLDIDVGVDTSDNRERGVRVPEQCTRVPSLLARISTCTPNLAYMGMREPDARNGHGPIISLLMAAARLFSGLVGTDVRGIGRATSDA